MENGMYVGIQANGRSFSTFIPEEVMNFENVNRRVDDRNAQRQAQQMRARAAAEKIRNRQRKAAAQEQRQKVQLVRIAVRMMLVCLVMFVAQHFRLVNDWFAVAIMVCCLAVICCRIGVFVGRRKAGRVKHYGY